MKLILILKSFQIPTQLGKLSFQKIKNKENGGETISHKASKNELESFFSEILPDYDEDRVYPSDIKKVIQWYNLLQKNGLLGALETEEEASDEEE